MVVVKCVNVQIKTRDINTVITKARRIRRMWERRRKKKGIGAGAIAE